MLTINEEFINNIIFDSTLNKIQCEILKISYPLKNNWKDELINKEISMEDAELLILLIGNLTIKAQKQILKNFKELYKFKKFIKEGSISKDIISKDVINPVKIYCDGACKGNPGNSGSGLAIYQNNIVTLYTGLFMELGTNNIAELNALKKALEIAKNYNEVTIYSDSMYAIDCITKWAYTWEKNNWVKKVVK